MSDELMTREVVGNRLAEAFGLRTPEPYIVEMGETALEGARAWFEANKAFCVFRKGFAAGCELVRFAGNFRPTPPLDPTLLPSVTRLFAFDLLTKYADRTAENPNCALRRRAGKGSVLDLFVFDFEQLFSAEERFALDGGGGESSWQTLVTLHCCRQFMVGQSAAITGLEADLVAAQNIDWRKVELSLPIAWQPEARQIIQEFKSVSANAFLSAVAEIVK